MAGTDPDFDLAALRVDTGDVEPVDWQPDVVSASIGAPVIALANRGGRGLRATLGFVSSPAARSAARGDARSPAASSTPLRCRAAPGAGRSSTPKDGCSA